MVLNSTFRDDNNPYRSPRAGSPSAMDGTYVPTEARLGRFVFLLLSTADLVTSLACCYIKGGASLLLNIGVAVVFWCLFWFLCWRGYRWAIVFFLLSNCAALIYRCLFPSCPDPSLPQFAYDAAGVMNGTIIVGFVFSKHLRGFFAYQRSRRKRV